ncbi:MAG: hypothetical protein RIS43_216 [Actinomycetota bacterium]|jgi:hypothetical protein
MKIRTLAAFIIPMMLLSSCGLSEARDKALAEAAVQPLSLENNWLPGLVAYPDYPAQGLGPQGYPGVSGSDSNAPENATQKFLASLGLQASDLRSGFTVKLYDTDGATLNAPTLDFCGATYATEEMRVERRQVEATASDSVFTFLSSEAVQYESVSAARLALKEVIDTKKKCPNGYQFEDVDGVTQTMTFHPAPGPATTVLVPATDRAILHFTQSSQNYSDTAFIAYQIRGNTLLAFYAVINGDQPLTQEELDNVYGVVSKLSSRLLAAKPVEVGL